MKKSFSLLAGMAFVLAFGLAYAEEDITLPQYSVEKMDKMTQEGSKMITNDDIQRFNLDQDQGTVNQMPESSGAGGSGAGGVTNDQDSWKNNTVPSLPSVDVPPVDEPAPGAGTSNGGTNKNKDMGGYHYGY